MASVQVKIPTILRVHADGAAQIEATGSSLGELLLNLDARFPGLTKRIRKPEGGLNRFVNIFINDQDARYLGELRAPLAEDDTVSIVPAVAGG